MEALIDWGYWGLFIGSFLAATVIPFSSDVLFLGLLGLGGDPLISVIVATAGNFLGGVTSYGLGYLGKWEWIEKYFKVSRERIEKQKAQVDRWGSILALFSWVPFIGDVMAIALGFYKVPFASCALFMLVGKCIRYVGWMLLYFWVF